MSISDMLQGMQEETCSCTLAVQSWSSLCDEMQAYSFQDMLGGCSHMHASVRYSSCSNSCIAIIIVVLYQPTWLCMHSFACSQNLCVVMTGCGQCMHLSLCVITVTAPIMACMSCMAKAVCGPIASFAL